MKKKVGVVTSIAAIILFICALVMQKIILSSYGFIFLGLTFLLGFNLKGKKRIPALIIIVVHGVVILLFTFSN
ncbi:hypothetical protein HPK19_10400 [Arthrobacter citreus]|nr:hypothetical protein HPK19_10400 [Arthrobacter citreus]